MNAPDTIDTSSGSSPYASASAGALADLQAPPATSPQAPETPPAGTEPLQPALPSPQATDPDILELKVKDQVTKLSLSKERERLVELAQKGLDYTQKTQVAADERRQIEAYAQALQAREKEIAEFLRDPVKVTQYAQFLLGQAGAQNAPPDPNAVATVQDLRTTLEAERKQIREEMAQELASVQFKAEVARYQGEYEADIAKTVATAIEKYPILDSLGDKDEVVELLKGDIARKGTQIATIEEARSAFQEMAKARADRLHEKVNDYAKMEAVRAAKLAKTGTEPPGGGAPAPQAQHFKLGDPRLTAAAIDDMNAGRR